MKHGSLFSGIGGFDLAAEWAGWENMFHCEWNDFGKRVLKYYWPKAESYGDITKTDFTVWRGRIDIVSGGFPCQPYSAAGKRLGTADARHLWPSMLRAIREIQPRWVVGENVRGLTDWNGGLVFDEVQADLEALGYEVTPFLLPACAVNAPHKRERIWFIAYGNRTGFQTKGTKQQTTRTEQYGELDSVTPHSHSDTARPSGASGSTESNGRGNHDEPEQRRSTAKLDTGSSDVLRNVANSQCSGLEKSEPGGQQFQLLDAERNDTQTTPHANGFGLRGESDRIGEPGQPDQTRPKPDWENFPTQSPICDGDDGLSAGLDGITFPKWRAESIKAGGNAIVPQVALQIFRAINEYELKVES